MSMLAAERVDERGSVCLKCQSWIPTGAWACKSCLTRGAERDEMRRAITGSAPVDIYCFGEARHLFAVNGKVKPTMRPAKPAFCGASPEWHETPQSERLMKLDTSLPGLCQACLEAGKK